MFLYENLIEDSSKNDLVQDSGAGTTITDLVDADDYIVHSRTYIEDSQYFLLEPEVGTNETGTCLTVAVQLLLSYNNWGRDGRIIPANTETEKFLKYDENSMTETELVSLFSQPYNRVLIETNSEYGTVNTISFYEKLLEYIDEDESGATLREAYEGINDYLNDYAPETKAQITINYSDSTSVSALARARNQIRNEIDANRPAIGTIHTYGNQNSRHAVVVYGYQDIRYNGEVIDGFIANFGWNDPDSNNAWFDADWLYGYLSFQTSHVHTNEIFADNSHILKCSVCERTAHTTQHNYITFEPLQEDSERAKIYHIGICSCGYKKELVHYSFDYANSDLYFCVWHEKRCQQCRYLMYEEHFVKHGECWFCDYVEEEEF